MTRREEGSQPEPTGSSDRLDDRVRELLTELPGSVAFQGLRRTLGVHPESLTRALRRLERDGAVERTQEGYRLAGTVAPRGRKDRLLHPVHPATPRWETEPRVELRLSPGEDASRMLGHLAGRWFGDFRWVGSFQEGERTTLLWVSRSGREQLGLEVVGDRLRIHHQGPVPEGDVPERPRAAYELLQHVLTALKGERPPREPLPAVLPYLMDEGRPRELPHGG